MASHFVRLESLPFVESSIALEEPRPVLDRLKLLEPGSVDRGELTLPVLREGEQYRFHFDMSRCIGCRSCEVACNEQNDNPPHVKWRRVGEIEGGSYPHVRRLHVSMSCNHCLEPSCLQGCPVDAYSKLANGIVAHDAEACIGCQYCTWSCPYGVPQYHPERRVVTKCHLCVDRIAGGGLPACVQACPTRAIEIESVDPAAWRASIAEGNAPGVPPADLTFSTTRITLPADLPDAMGHSESWQLKPEAPHWPLVVLLVLSQWSVGLFASSTAASTLAWLGPTERRTDLAIVSALASAAAFLVGSLALGASVLHLGKPLHAFRALRAWRRSWLSREAAAFLVFAFLGAAAAGASVLAGLEGRGDPRAAGLLALATLAGSAGIASSAGIYRIAARPAWDSWRTPAQFFLTLAFLGGAGSLTLSYTAGAAWGSLLEPAAIWSIGASAIGAAVCQACIPWTLVTSGLASEESPLVGTALLLTQRFRGRLWMRTLLLAASAALLLAALVQSDANLSLVFSASALVAGLGAEITGRYLFFVTVVPRNMPGHFFNRNSPLGH
jgi:DMSO reductase iron-sulfur subunit